MQPPTVDERLSAIEGKLDLTITKHASSAAAVETLLDAADSLRKTANSLATTEKRLADTVMALKPPSDSKFFIVAAVVAAVVSLTVAFVSHDALARREIPLHSTAGTASP